MNLDDNIILKLMKCLTDSSPEIVRNGLILYCQISKDSEEKYFKEFISSLIQLFMKDRVLLETRGHMILKELCTHLDPEIVFCAIAENIELNESEEFSNRLVQSLTLILVTSELLSEVRYKLRNISQDVC